MPQNWFAVDAVDEATYIISEYRHWEETHCYLLIGERQALLIDTGLGVGDISAVVQSLTDKPIMALATHAHWDHIGGHGSFSNILCHTAEKPWLEGDFPLSPERIRTMLPEDFDREAYEIYSGGANGFLKDGDSIELGGRSLRVLHTPGHSPGHMCLWEGEKGRLFSGDLVYGGRLYANYPSTDPQAYLASLEKICALPIKEIFPGHHSLDIGPELALRMRDALRELDAKGLLRHGSGEHCFDGWSILM